MNIIYRLVTEKQTYSRGFFSTVSVRIILLIQACVASLREVLGPLVPEEAILQVGLLALNPEHPYLSQSFLGYSGILDVSLS